MLSPGFEASVYPIVSLGRLLLNGEALLGRYGKYASARCEKPCKQEQADEKPMPGLSVQGKSKHGDLEIGQRKRARLGTARFPRDASIP